jgi:hypothetical protein
MTTEHVHRWLYYDDLYRDDRDTAPARLTDLTLAMYEDPDPRAAPHRQCQDCYVVEWAVPAITVQQPWAACIALGRKDIELRSRPPRWRGPLAIHAGTRWSERGEHDQRVQDTLTNAVWTCGTWTRQDFDGVQSPEFAHGAVIALTTLSDCHPAAGCCPPWGDNTYDGKPVHHLVLSELRPVNIPPWMPGRLGVWVAYLPWPVTERHECTSCGEEYADSLLATPAGSRYCTRVACALEWQIDRARTGVRDDYPVRAAVSDGH